MVDLAAVEELQALRVEHQELGLTIAEKERELRSEMETDIPKGTPITKADASVKYGLDEKTIRNWAARQWVATIEVGRRGRGGAALFDEHDIAAIALRFNITEGRRMDRLIDSE